MNIQHLPEQERPRERLLQGGPTALSDIELLSILIGHGSRGMSAIDIAQRLLSQHRSLRELLSQSADTLCREPGFGMTKYCQLQAAFEMTRRYYKESLNRPIQLNHSEATAEFVLAELRDHDQEVFACQVAQQGAGRSRIGKR